KTLMMRERECLRHHFALRHRQYFHSADLSSGRHMPRQCTPCIERHAVDAKTHRRNPISKLGADESMEREREMFACFAKETVHGFVNLIRAFAGGVKPIEFLPQHKGAGFWKMLNSGKPGNGLVTQYLKNPLIAFHYAVQIPAPRLGRAKATAHNGDPPAL